MLPVSNGYFVDLIRILSYLLDVGHVVIEKAVWCDGQVKEQKSPVFTLRLL